VDDHTWKQLNIAYPGENHIEREHHAVAHLIGVFPALESEGMVGTWWYIRKTSWRIRYRLADPDAVHDPVHQLLTEGMSWTRDIYEPEIHAFGGPASMDLAHILFHHDSRHLLAYLGEGAAERKEFALILCTALMRGAGLDINEQGDVWARVAEQRAALLTTPVDPHTWTAFVSDTRHLLRGRARTDKVDGDWLTGFYEAGRGLRALRDQGSLTRGFRAIAALHVIFMLNRIGIPGTTQAYLVKAAKDAVFG
jgi:thiopeptide-type bacteriocin biosynthesis protein